MTDTAICNAIASAILNYRGPLDLAQGQTFKVKNGGKVLRGITAAAYQLGVKKKEIRAEKKRLKACEFKPKIIGRAKHAGNVSKLVFLPEE
jgi:hypothetical protein